MPADLFTLQGQWGTSPQTGGLLGSGATGLLTPILEQVTLDEKQLAQYDLTSDSPQVVDFGGVTNANVVIIACDRKVRVRITTTDGATQSIPVDDTLILISRTVAVTAIDLTRVPATETNVAVFLGEKA